MRTDAMDLALGIMAVVTLIGAAAAMRLRNLVHCALCLVVSLAGLAAIYLWMNAMFIGLAQVLVYVGAVSILIVFAILLTRGSEAPSAPVVISDARIGAAVALLVLGGLVLSILASPAIERRFPAEPTPGIIPPGVIAPAPPPPAASVKRIGEELMTTFVVPLQAVALLLTATMIGAVIIAMPERRGPAAVSGTAPSPGHEARKEQG